MEKKKVFTILGATILVTLLVSLYSLFFGNQYMVIFDSNGGSEVESQLVQVGKQVEEPETPTRDGYEFVEWQLNGKSYDFTSKITKKITLVAQWRKIVQASEIFYTIIFDSNGGSEVAQQTISPGELVTKPTDPVRDGYIFVGWYNGTAEFDFSKKVSQDMTLTAKWKSTSTDQDSTKEEEEETSGSDTSSASSKFQVGDKVKIVGEYAESSTSTTAIHSRAIGWTRIVLKVYEGREYPYRVGDSTGTTGFFKAESLEKID